jgi:long-chain acyl-CoA synthetase
VVSLIDPLAVASESRPEQPGIIDDAGRVLTYGEWMQQSRRVAAIVGDRVPSGSFVLLAFSNADVLAYAAAFYGIVGAGSVAVPVSLPAPPAVIEEAFTRVGANLVLTSQRLGADVPTLILGDLGSGPGADLRRNFDPDALAQVLFSSGTTGRPKAIAVPHGNLSTVPKAEMVQRDSRRPQVLHSLPIGSSAFQNQLFRSVALDYTVHVLRLFNPGKVLRILQEGDVTSLVLVPAMVALLLEAAENGDEFSRVESIGTTGSFFQPGRHAALRLLFPNAIITTNYGSTEAAPAGTSGLVDPERPLRVGWPNPGCEVRVTDDFGDEVACGAPGAIWMRAKGVPPRRYLNPDASDDDVFQHGWTRMGDLGCLDVDGSLLLINRSSQAISVGGTKVSGPEVEATISRHPDVVDCAVFGEDHDVLGQELFAEIVTRAAVSESDILQFLRQRLAREKVPTSIRFVASIRRNSMGKRPSKQGVVE